MTFQQLLFAVEVSKCDSFNKAAEQLYTHQSNVSTVIKQLEDELGIQIFERTKKGVHPTDEGKEFLGYAREIISRMQFVENMYEVRSRNPKQYFSISSMRAYYLSQPFIDAYEMLLKEDDALYVRMNKTSFTSVLDDVAHSHAEIGVIFTLNGHLEETKRICKLKQLTPIILGQSRIHAVVRKDHPVLKEENPLQHLTEYPYIITETQENFGRFYDDSSKSLLQLFQTEPKCLISVSDSVASQDIVAHTDAFFISMTEWKHSEHYKYASIPFEGDDNLLTHMCVIRREHSLSRVGKLYLDHLQTLLDK